MIRPLVIAAATTAVDRWDLLRLYVLVLAVVMLLHILDDRRHNKP